MDIIRHHFATIDSTNNWAKHNSHSFSRDKISLVTADEQTAGRGRFKRKWESPPLQNIYATFCFFIEKHRQDIGNIPQVLALSVLATLKALGFHPKLKWPNDILLSQKKIAGILAETTTISDQICVMIGIGVNINMPKELLDKIDRPATSLLVEGGQVFLVEDILQLLIKKFQEDLDLFLEEGFFPFLELYKSELAYSIDHKIRFHDNRSIWEGFFHSINHDGTLNLRLESGDIKTFVSGEILFEIKDATNSK